MKEGWETKTLDNVASIYNGNSINADYKKEHFLGLAEGYPFIATKDVAFDGTVDYNNGVKIPFDTDYKIAEPQSAFICVEGGSAGRKIAYITQKVCFGNKLFCVKPLNSHLVGKFVYYFLSSEAFQVQFRSLLTGLIGGVSAKKFKSIEISYPSLAEQQQIVSFLDSEFEKIDALKANAETQLQAAKDLFQAALKELLTPKEGWVEKNLGEVITNLRTGLNPRTHFKLNTPDATYNYITVRELKGFDIVADEKTDKVNAEALNRINKRSNLLKGDVLFSGTGTIGNTALVTTLPETWNIKEGIYALTPNHKVINSKFLIYVISSDFFLNNARKKAEGTGVKSIPMKRFVELAIYIPNMFCQEKCVAKLDALSANVKALQTNYTETITLCNDLKQALLKKVFG
ncbi:MULTISPECIES: restriction endonuclease subunit S [unclassified Bacteroides]|uniref:restriction endonuclease subunit S n=1 Tax=unclassified Bacteroides TaxID=2646097 RepID=UPI00068F2AEC|nr:MULTISPECIES: restriction endonuclease subunit S [unclassified Bacteroides]